MIVVLILALVLMLIAIIALASWGTATAATAFTLSATVASMQNTIALLTCVLVACLPLIVFGAWRLGVLIGERKRAHTAPMIQLAERTQPPMIEPTPAPLQLPTPRVEDIQPFIPPAHRVIKRTSPRTQRAARIAKRWFQ